MRREIPIKFITAKGGKAFFFKLAITLLILAAVFWAGRYFGTSSLRQLALTQIAELTGAEVTARALSFSLNGSVFIEDLLIKPRRRSEYDDAILKAKEVYVRFSIVSLLTGNPSLAKLNIKDFIFNTQYDMDARQWNLNTLKVDISAGSERSLPAISLKRGVLKYTRIYGGKVGTIAVIPLDVKFGYAGAKRGGYYFNIATASEAGIRKNNLTGFWKEGQVTVTGGIVSSAVPAFERTWAINMLTTELTYDKDRQFSLKLMIKDIVGTYRPVSDISPLTVSETPVNQGIFLALQEFFDRYRPSGKIDLALEASGSLDNLGGCRAAGKLECRDVAISDRRFPYKIEHIAGTIDLTEKSVMLNNLTGRHGDVKLSFGGQAQRSDIDWTYIFKITSGNMLLDNDLYSALTVNEQALWSSFAPTGTVAIDYNCSGSPTDAMDSLAIKLVGVEAAYTYFPYPLKKLDGTLLFEKDDISILDVVSQYDGRKININGKVTNCNTDLPGCDILVRAADIPLDTTLGASLPAGQRRFYSQLNVTGTGDADIKIFTTPQDPTNATYIADVSLRQSSMKMSEDSPVVSKVSAKAAITADSVDIKQFDGFIGDSAISLSGKVWMGQREGEGFQYCLSLGSDDAVLSEELFGMLPAKLAKILHRLNPQGRIKYRADLDNAPGRNCSSYKVKVECLGNNAGIEPFPDAFKGITGKLTITEDGLVFDDVAIASIDNVWLSPDASAIKVNGRLAFAGDAFRGGRLVITSEEFGIKGKSLTDLSAAADYDPNSGIWFAEYITAGLYGGKLTGRLDLRPETDGTCGYLLQTGFTGVDLNRFLSDTDLDQPAEHTSGKMAGSLSISGQIGVDNLPVGRCRLDIVDMQVGKLSPLAKILSVLKLTAPGDYAFERMVVDSYIKQNTFSFERFDLSGKAIAFSGSGSLDMKTQNVDLNLTARGRRLATEEPSIFQSLTESLGHAIVRMKVTGNLYNPQINTQALPVIEDTLGVLGTEKLEKKSKRERIQNPEDSRQ